VKTFVSALDIAADYQRDRAKLCADCTSQSCPACESRLRDAQAYDRLSAQLDQAATVDELCCSRVLAGQGRYVIIEACRGA